MAEGRALRKIDKYEILAEISSGTTGTVFRVQFESQTFALKRLNFADATSIARFKQEAASIARLNHPNLVRIIDAGESEGTHFIVMELLEGKSLDIRIREGRFGVDDVIELAKSLASALAEVHRFGLIHRDVKPANIVILENGVAKLLDFGLVADTVSGALAGGREIAGTILYTSPEQIRILKRPVDARSDLYSLGITLFECICGRPPFQSDDIPELMRMHASAVAPSIQILAPEISTSVARIIAKLLEKDPDDRYQCAEGLVYDLQNLSKIEMAEKANGKVSIGIRDRQLSTMGLLPISGRKAELALLHQYFSDVESGKGTAILIEGESGCGKSRLTQELIFRAISSGGLVLHGKAQLQSNRTPFAPVREALEKLVQAYRALPPDEQVVWREKFNLSAQHAPKILVALAKPLKDIISSEQSEKVALSDESDGQRTLDDIATFIINLAIHFPNTLLLIDDVQWMDSRSVELLSRIAHRFHTAGILLLTTSRNDTESLDALNVFKGLMAPMLKPAIALGALSLDDVRDIVSKQLGNLPLKEGAVERIAASANGNPFVIAELIRSLLQNGSLQFVRGTWAINQDGISSIAISGNVLQLIVNRVRALSPGTRKALNIAAVMGNVFDADLIVRSVGMNEDTVVRALQEATQASLITSISGSRYRFTHDKIREALNTNQDPVTFREINDSLAEYLQLQDEKSWFDLARFYLDGNLNSHQLPAAVACYEAAVQALSNFAFERAYELLRQALDLTKTCGADKNVIRRSLTKLVISCMSSGREREAHESVDAALGLATNREETIELWHLKLRAYHVYGRNSHAWVTFKKTIGILGEPFPRYPLWRLISINWLLIVVSFKLLTGIGFGSVYRNRKKLKSKELFLAIYLLGERTAIWKEGGGLDRIYICLKLLYYAHSFGNSSYLARALCQVTGIISNLRFTSVARSLIDQAYRVADITKDEATKVHVQFFELMAQMQGDQVRNAKFSEELGADVMKFLGPQEYSQWVYFRLQYYFHKGLHREAMTFIGDHFERIVSLGNKFFTAHMLGQIKLHAAILGQIQESVKMHKDETQMVEAELKDDANSVMRYVAEQLYFAYEQRSLGSETDRQIEYLMSHKRLDIFFRFNFANVGQIRLAQLEMAKSPDERRRARLLLKAAIRDYVPRAFGDSHLAQLCILKAGLARNEGNFSSALRLAEKGYSLASRVQNKVAVWKAVVERAKILTAMADDLRGVSDAQLGYEIAAEGAWTGRARLLEEQFGALIGIVPDARRVSNSRVDTLSGRATFLGATRSERDSAKIVAESSLTRLRPASGILSREAEATVQSRAGSTSSNTMISTRMVARTRVGVQAVTIEERALSALSRIALASSYSLDPVEQTRAVLDELLKLFGAERAFLFTVDDQNEIEQNGVS